MDETILLDRIKKLEAELDWALEQVSTQHGNNFPGCSVCERLVTAQKVLEDTI